MPPYDSPTFLGNKDKLLLGMTIGQVGIFVGSGAVWLLLALSFEFSMMMSLLIFGPAHAVTVAFMLVKIAGMAVPMYLMAMVTSWFASAVYHVDADRARQGLEEWFDAVPDTAAETAEDWSRVRLEGKTSRRWLGPLLKFRGKATATARTRIGQEAGTLASLEAEQRSNDAARGLQRSIRTMFRMVVKGQA